MHGIDQHSHLWKLTAKVSGDSQPVAQRKGKVENHKMGLLFLCEANGGFTICGFGAYVPVRAHAKACFYACAYEWMIIRD
jgi:hypothetical protein